MKKIITLCLSLCMTAALAAPAYALEYSIDAPDDYDFGRNTSIEVIHTADGGAMLSEPKMGGMRAAFLLTSSLRMAPQPAGSTLVRYRCGSMMFSLLPKMFCSTSSPYL